MVSLNQLHESPDEFPNPKCSIRSVSSTKPSSLSWMLFGGGVRRCIGASFANMEMDVVLRTVLRNFTIETTDAPGEKWHSRGVAYTPEEGRPGRHAASRLIA